MLPSYQYPLDNILPIIFSSKRDRPCRSVTTYPIVEILGCGYPTFESAFRDTCRDYFLPVLICTLIKSLSTRRMKCTGLSHWFWSKWMQFVRSRPLLSYYQVGRGTPFTIDWSYRRWNRLGTLWSEGRKSATLPQICAYTTLFFPQQKWMAINKLI